jgi:hypothetical protein
LRDFIDVVPEGEASDFLYQVNRYRPSRAFEGINVNRLEKWSVAQIQLVALNVGSGASTGQALFFMSLDMDVNTSADFAGQLPRDRIDAIIEDLRAAAEELATTGDRVR